MKNSKNILNAMIAVTTLYARIERAVNTLQQLLARRRSVMDAIKTLLERSDDAVGTGVHDITDKYVILRRPHSALTGFQKAVASPFGVTGA